MKFIELKQSELKKNTQFLFENKIILHPKISPNGIPDFTGYEEKQIVLILDRNILVRILRLVNNGELKDVYSLQLISSLFVWSELYNIYLTSGLALIEYSYFQKGNNESSEENNIFLEIFKQYTLQDWLDLATGRVKIIPKLKLVKQESYSFFIEDDHFKMHYLEMLKLAQLFFNRKISTIEKFELFHQWVYKNLLICKYTSYFAVLLFGNKSKIFQKVNLNYEEINKVCINEAWDLTYLSFWSTQYYYEESASSIYLFATMDKELRNLFFLTHKETYDIYIEIFGNDKGKNIINSMSKIYLPRIKPDINQNKLDRMIKEEQENLKTTLN